MKKAHSRRWDATEKRMEDAALQLMEAADAEQVSVRAICAAAQVNRTTFYAHFEDFPDLAARLSARMREELMESFAAGEQEPFSAASFVPFLRFVREHQGFYRIVLRSRRDFPIQEGLEELLSRIMRPVCQRAGIESEDEIMSCLVFIQAGFTMCLRRWVDGGCAMPEDRLAETLAACIPERFRKQDGRPEADFG